MSGTGTRIRQFPRTRPWVWRRLDADPRGRIALAAFAGRFVLTLAWSAAFFGAQSIGPGLVVIAAR